MQLTFSGEQFCLYFTPSFKDEFKASFMAFSEFFVDDVPASHGKRILQERAESLFWWVFFESCRIRCVSRATEICGETIFSGHHAEASRLSREHGISLRRSQMLPHEA